MIDAQSTRSGPRKQDYIFASALNLLAERGYDGLTIEAVAADSGVNKTTIYRWWPSKDALLAAALVDTPLLGVEIPDTGSLRGDLIVLARTIATLLTGTGSAPLVATVLSASAQRPELAAVAHRFFADRLERERPIFARAVARGELPPAADPEQVMDLIAGALWFRILLRGSVIEPADADRIVDAVLDGAGRIRPAGHAD